MDGRPVALLVLGGLLGYLAGVYACEQRRKHALLSDRLVGLERKVNPPVPYSDLGPMPVRIVTEG